MTTMWSQNIFWLYLTSFFGLYQTQSNHTEKVANYVYLLDLYKSGNHSIVDIIPLANTSNAMVIDAEIELYSLNDFDEISGQIELATSVTFVWTDEIVEAVTGSPNSAVFASSTPTYTLLVPYNKIWTPKVVLYNSVSSTASIGGDEYMCRYTLVSGDVTWSPKILIKSACSPDVTYYPFDRQTCIFSLVTWRFTADEILFRVTKSEWILTAFEENGEWIVEKTVAKTEIYDNQSFLRLSITIERKPLYFAFNIILPVIALSFLTLMVFWLPSDSGERVGYAVTCFLSFVVLLNTIMEILPKSSSPMSYLCYYVVVMMIFSGLVTTLTIIQVRIFYKIGNQKVPRCLQKIIMVLKCGRGKVMVSSNDTGGVKTTEAMAGAPTIAWESGKSKATDVNRDWCTPEPPSSPEPPKVDKSEGRATEVTWAEVGRYADLVFFLGFLAAQVFFSVMFLVPVALRV